MNTFPIIIRPEYLEICEGDHCAAAILDLFKRWSASKLKKKADSWIYKSQPELCEDLMGLFGRNRVGIALLKLRDWGYLNHRQNPRNRQDKTLQYQLNMPIITECLALLSVVSELKNDAPEGIKEGSEALNLKPQAPDLSDEESRNLSLISSGITSEESSSTPAPHPDDDDLQIFKSYENRFGEIETAVKVELRGYRQLLSSDRLRAVMGRCETSVGRSWAYVLKALQNEAQREGRDKTKWHADDNHALPTSALPPGFAPLSNPDEADTDDDREITTHGDTAGPEEETKPDIDRPAFDPECMEAQAWRTAYSQLEIQLDRGTFNTWLRSAWLYKIEGRTLTVGVPNSYVADMLNHRMKRDILRMVNECAEQPVEVMFEVHSQPVNNRPLPLNDLIQKGNAA